MLEIAAVLLVGYAILFADPPERAAVQATASSTEMRRTALMEPTRLPAAPPFTQPCDEKEARIPGQ